MKGVVRDGKRAIARTKVRDSQPPIIAACARFAPDRILYAAAIPEPGSNPKCSNC